MAVRIATSFLLSFILIGCGSSASIEKTWVDKDVHTKDLQGVLVVAVAPTAEGRSAFEQEFTEALQKKGIHAVASYKYKGGKEIDKADVVAIATKAEVDTVLVTLFAGRDQSEVLHPGRKYYSYAPVYGRDAYGRGRVYGVPYQVGQTSDFWAQHKSIHLTAKLYEIKTEELLWQAYSGMEEQSDINAMRPKFIKSFMQDLADQGLVD
jgi:hypothetical protein